MVLTDQPGADSWPITGASFILIYEKQAKPRQAREVLKFFAWSYKHGGQAALGLDYVPMPDKVVEMVEKTWADTLRDGNGGAIWP